MKAPISWNIFRFYCRKFVVIIPVSRLYVHMSNPYMISFIAQNQKGSSRFRHFCWVDITDGPRHNLNMRDMKFFNFTQRQDWPGARSLAWLDERASGRLWRSRFILLKPMGISGSDMLSRFSADAKDTLLAWSARAGCVGLSRVTRGVRVCETEVEKSGEKNKSTDDAERSMSWHQKHVQNRKQTKLASGNQCKETKDCKNLLLAQIHTFNLRQRSFTSSSTHRDSKQSEPKPKIRAAQTARLNKPTSQTQGHLP